MMSYASRKTLKEIRESCVQTRDKNKAGKANENKDKKKKINRSLPSPLVTVDNR